MKKSQKDKEKREKKKKERKNSILVAELKPEKTQMAKPFTISTGKPHFLETYYYYFFNLITAFFFLKLFLFHSKNE